MKQISKKLSSHPLLRGTILLTLSSLLCRLLGFLYRIMVSNTIGSLGMGLYELTINVVTFGLFLSVSGCRVVLTQKISQGRERAFLDTSIIYTTVKSVIISALIYAFAPYISTNILKTKTAVNLLRLLAIFIPPASFHSMAEGYLLGKSNHERLCISQLIEETGKICTFFILYLAVFKISPNVSLMAYALIGSEVCSCLYVLKHIKMRKMSFSFSNLRELLKLAAPLTLTRIFLTLSGTLKTVLLPTLFLKCNMSREATLRFIGTVRGMAIPVILLPASIMVSYSSLLLPKISAIKNDAAKRGDIISKSLYICLSMGCLSVLGFLFCGARFAAFAFRNEDLNLYVKILSFLCPFINISLTFGSILNGLGMTKYYMRNNILAVTLELSLMITLIPGAGVYGYLISMLCGEASLAMINLITVKKRCL